MTYVSIYTPDRICEHGVEIRVTVKHETEEIS